MKNFNNRTSSPIASKTPRDSPQHHPIHNIRKSASKQPSNTCTMAAPGQQSDTRSSAHPSHNFHHHSSATSARPLPNTPPQANPFEAPCTYATTVPTTAPSHQTRVMRRPHHGGSPRPMSPEPFRETSVSSSTHKRPRGFWETVLLPQDVDVRLDASQMFRQGLLVPPRETPAPAASIRQPSPSNVTQAASFKRLRKSPRSASPHSREDLDSSHGFALECNVCLVSFGSPHGLALHRERDHSDRALNFPPM